MTSLDVFLKMILKYVLTSIHTFDFLLLQLQNNDFVALTCAQNRPLPKYEDAVSLTCEAAMWKFKFDLTKDTDHGLARRIQKVNAPVFKTEY